MQIPTEGEARVLFRDCPPEKKAERLEAARLLWGDGWEQLSEREQEIAARTMHTVVEVERLPRYSCHLCLAREGDPGGGYVGNQARPGEVAAGVWFCTCRAGVQAEAGYWYPRVFKRVGRGKDVRVEVIPEGQQKFNAYLRERRNGVEVREAVNQLAGQKEQEGE
jgi:hypothetical protein